jgi:hypothetical protein
MEGDMPVVEEEIINAEVTEAIVPAPPPSALSIQRAPDVVLEEAQRAAKAIKDVIESKPKKVVLKGKTYLQYEDWQTLGRFYGVTAIVRSTETFEYGDVKGFKASADALLVGTNTVISSAEAICMADEPNWVGKPTYSILSMAQTRACAKALRNVLAWVVVLAGYAPTPAEELNGDIEEERKPHPRPPQKKPQAQAVVEKPAVVEVKAPPPAAKEKPAKTWRATFWGHAKAIGKKSDAQIREFVGSLGYQSTSEIPDELKGQCMNWADEEPLPWDE